MLDWGIYRYPTPTKKIKSLSLLRKKIAEFFAQTNSDPENAEDLPTPSQLAVFLGYPSALAMYKEINNPDVDPEYGMALDRAVDILKDNIQRRQLRYAEARKDWQGVDAVLQRIDKAIESTQPVEDKKNSINININVEQQERISNFIDEKMKALMEQAEDAKIVEVPLLGTESEA